MFFIVNTFATFTNCLFRSRYVCFKQIIVQHRCYTMMGSNNVAINLPVRPPPVVVILGSTGSGKSKLAIDLAKHVGGEVISADSMQVYTGLDILTNKATKDEMQGIPHHGISVIDRTQKYDVVKFRDTALPLVEELLARGKVPFIVGGTNYYIESLLWKVLMEDKSDTSDNDNEGESFTHSKKARVEISNMTPPLQYMEDLHGNFTEAEVTKIWTPVELHHALEVVDPMRALKIHPNDRRKVVRSLQVFFRTGKRHSELIEEQCAVSSDSEESENEDDQKTPVSLTPKLGGPLRFPNSFCIWIQAERDILNRRIEDRVDKMVERGLRAELDAYISTHSQENRIWDFQGGQLQSIGVKEFKSYIELPENERTTGIGKKEFDNGLERLKIVTKQYAKRQVQWMKQRFLKSHRREVPPVYGLNGNETSDEEWSNNVTIPATEILEALTNNQLNISTLKEKRLLITKKNEVEDFVSRTCDVCQKVLSGSSQWENHIKSAKHWKMMKRQKKLIELENNPYFKSKDVASAEINA